MAKWGTYDKRGKWRLYLLAYVFAECAFQRNGCACTMALLLPVVLFSYTLLKCNLCCSDIKHNE